MPESSALLKRGRLLEWLTLGWNVVGTALLAYLAVAASSVALAGFGLDSLIEIGASIVVLWELAGTGSTRQRRALRLIAVAFVSLAGYLVIQSTLSIVAEHRPSLSIGGIVWTAITAAVMFTLAAQKSRVGSALPNPVLATEGRVTFVDGVLAVTVLLGVSLDGLFGFWWADAIAGYVLAFYAIREVVHIVRDSPVT